MAKEQSKEYLSEALKEVRKVVPGWVYVTIVAAARGRTGGKAKKLKQVNAALSAQDKEFEESTNQHREWVAENLSKISLELGKRARSHDDSKFDEPERKLYAAAFQKLKDTKFGSPEYLAAVKMLGPALTHHFASNRHHPEFHTKGVNGMTLIDLTEMLCDWVSAGKREGQMLKADFKSNAKRLKIGTQLEAILMNTWEGLETITKSEEIEVEDHMPTQGPGNGYILFVGAQPSLLEQSRGELMVGSVGETFNKLYANPLNFFKSDVAITNAVPTTEAWGPEAVAKWADWLEKEIENVDPLVVVALGKEAEKALKGKADFTLPHPAVITKRKDSGELGRKIRQIKSALKLAKQKRFDTDTGKQAGSKAQGNSPDSKSLADTTGRTHQKETAGMETNTVSIAKADTAKRIVYGVVADPYGKKGAQPDAHEDWFSPGVIEADAHAFMQGDRVIGVQHSKKAHAQLVESWVEQYPTEEEYKKALQGLDHKVSRRKFGDDVIHSGSWVVGVKLGPAEWKKYLDGDINAFSPGAMGTRKPISLEELPKVTFVDLVEGRA